MKMILITRMLNLIQMTQTAQTVKMPVLGMSKRQTGSDQLFKLPVKDDIGIVQLDDIFNSLDQQPLVHDNRQQFVVKYNKLTCHKPVTAVTDFVPLYLVPYGTMYHKFAIWYRSDCQVLVTSAFLSYRYCFVCLFNVNETLKHFFSAFDAYP